MGVPTSLILIFFSCRGTNREESDDIQVGKVNEGDAAHSHSLDQEALVGGKAARRKLTELSDEDAQKEIR